MDMSCYKNTTVNILIYVSCCLAHTFLWVMYLGVESRGIGHVISSSLLNQTFPKWLFQFIQPESSVSLEGLSSLIVSAKATPNAQPTSLALSSYRNLAHSFIFLLAPSWLQEVVSFIFAHLGGCSAWSIPPLLETISVYGNIYCVPTAYRQY